MSFLVNVNKAKPSDATIFNFLVKNLKKVDVIPIANGNEAFDADLRPDSCESIEELIDALISKLKLPPSAIDCFHVMMATVVSLKISGPLLWLHCVGPSSGLKTTFAGLIASAADKCFMISNFNGFYSGYKSTTDTSLLPLLQGKTLIIPDLTPLLQSTREHQDKVFGELRDVYDGKGTRHYNNGVTRNYSNVIFACITCTTDAIRKFGRSDLGERFLMAEINASWDADGRLCPEVIDTSTEGNAFSSVLGTIASGFDAPPDEPVSMDSLAPERAKCWGLLNHLMEWISEESNNLSKLAQSVAANAKFKQEVESLSIWLEYARCPLPKRGEDQNIRARPALPHRTIKQLAKLTIALCVVSKTTELTDNIRRLVRKVAFDTACCDVLELMNMLATKGLQAKDMLAIAMNRSPTWIAHLCDHLQSIGVVCQEFKSNGSGNRGRPMLCYSLTSEFKVHAKIIGLCERDFIAPKPKPVKTLAQMLNQHVPNVSFSAQDESNGTPPAKPMGFLARLKAGGK